MEKSGETRGKSAGRTRQARPHEESKDGSVFGFAARRLHPTTLSGQPHTHDSSRSVRAIPTAVFRIASSHGVMLSCVVGVSRKLSPGFELVCFVRHQTAFESRRLAEALTIRRTAAARMVLASTTGWVRWRLVLSTGLRVVVFGWWVLDRLVVPSLFCNFF